MNHDEHISAALARYRYVGATDEQIRAFVSYRMGDVYRPEADAEALNRMQKARSVVHVGDRWYLTPQASRAARGSAVVPEWQFSDAWVLLAILYSSSGTPATIEQIKSTADYINHAVPAREELFGALNRLASGKLIRVKGGGMLPTERAIELFEKAKSVCKNQTLCQLNALRRLIDCPCCGVELKKVQWKIHVPE